MDDSVQPACPESIFERPPAEMISSALGSIDDLSFDWHGFKDFLLNDKNFDTILNALQKDADHQSAVNQQQYFHYSNNWVPESSFGGQYAAPPFTYLHQPANGVPEPSIVGQYTALPVTYFNHAAPIPTEGVSPAAPSGSTASAAQDTANAPGQNGESPTGPQIYINTPPNGFMFFLKEQRPKLKRADPIVTYLAPMWNSRPNHPEEKIHKAHVKKQHFKHAAPIPTEGVSPTAPTSYTASAAHETVNKSRKIIASSAAPQVYIKKPPNAFMLFLKEQRPLVRPELKTSGSKAVLTYLGAVWKSMPTEQKEKYYKEAEMKKILHKEQNPGWSTKDNYGKKLTKAGKRRLIKNSGT